MNINRLAEKMSAWRRGENIVSGRAVRIVAVLALFTVVVLSIGPSFGAEPQTDNGRIPQTSDHYDGEHYFNPSAEQPATPADNQPRRGSYSWIKRWIFGGDWSEWNPGQDLSPGPRPEARVPEGAMTVIPVGHATFLIQMDGLNILTDPIWSERCSPVSWAGPRRHRTPGIRFEDLPPIDVVLVSHNHYDHLDRSTLEKLARKGVALSLTALGNRQLIRDAGIPAVVEMDWWQSFRLSPQVVVTLVPAQHFSARTLWDRNKTLWGGFVVSGPSGHLYFAGDTGYGPHFREIFRRFGPIRVAILPIAPFRLQQPADPPFAYGSVVHMGPVEAVQAHLDLGADVSIAAHFRVFQLGPDGFDDAVNLLASTLKKQRIRSDTFITPQFGKTIALPELPERISYRLAR